MRYELDLVVLGGGTGGFVSAVTAADLGARVALIERDRTGGDCSRTGCVPSKSLISAGRLAHRMRTAHALRRLEFAADENRQTPPGQQVLSEKPEP